MASPSNSKRLQNIDVRMRGFTSRSPLKNALDWLDAQLKPLAAESVTLDAAAGRVLTHDIVSHLDVPQFDRAMMDGVALRAADTQGASTYNRLSLKLVGTCLPGQPFTEKISSGQAVRIMTGAPMPSGADAVLPVEKTEIHESSVEAIQDVSPGKHVGKSGEDISAGTVVFQSGRRLRPQDVGLLSSIGAKNISVVGRPRVRIVVTGNELLPPGSQPSGYQIVDANGPMLAALVSRDGGVADPPTQTADDRELIRTQLLCEADVILFSGGSSVGEEDHVPILLAQHGTLAIHGVAMRPSSPTGMGRIANRLVFLLPGNPVSCLCAYDFFAGRALRSLGGRVKRWPYPSKKASLQRKLSSVVGRVDYARVRLVDGEVVPLAISGASLLSSTTRADGFVVVPTDSEGFPPGSEVEVFLYDLSPEA